MRFPKLCGLPKKMKRLPGLRRSKFQRMPLKNTISILPLASSTMTLILLHLPVRMELSSWGMAEEPGPYRVRETTIARICTEARSGVISAMGVMPLRST